ncbi:MAG: TIGR00282 family metallophosphoesterase [Nitrospiraceae bacterium]|nr:MAG: TIGR00282 family metallophosphoesterase [Nitrospiraceae bacterium]
MKILFIGDIVGNPGRDAVKEGLPGLVSKLKIDFVIANAENAAGGFGVTQAVGEEILSLGVDVLTSGNHIWDKKEALTYIAKESRLLRPANYPAGVPGFGSIVMNTPGGEKVAVLNLSGRVFMNQLDCPFMTAQRELVELKKETKVIIVDMHAEATSEKSAIGWFLDGEVSAVIGTHTHVQTADEKILPRGTAFISDAGMTGPADSIIGVKKEQIIQKFLTQIPTRFETAKGKALLSCVVVEINPKTGFSTSIQRLQLSFS